jgi:NAD(P)H dehydrogenase (quinone)
MRVLVLHAHPDPASFSAALYRETLAALNEAGHTVTAFDLYERGFNPVLSRAEWQGYAAVPGNRAGLEADVAAVMEAEAIVFVFPVWNFGLPAMLKGYLDRVFLPGVSFHLTDTRIAPGLQHVKRLVVVTTYGSTRFWSILMGDPPRKIFHRMLRVLIHPRGRCLYLAHHAIEHSTAQSRATFVARVRQTLLTL